MKQTRSATSGYPLLIILALIMTLPASARNLPEDMPAIEKLEERIYSFIPDPRYRDDPYALVTLKEGIAALKSGSGGIGACLVDERTGRVVELGRNRQYASYFRSDLHAEMDLLTRYEDRMKKPAGNAGCNPRTCEGLVLYSSLEPCPMCLTRIINSGIKKMYYVAPDPEGGMVTRQECLPPFWQRFARDREFARARCSPGLCEMASELFHFSARNFKRE